MKYTLKWYLQRLDLTTIVSTSLPKQSINDLHGNTSKFFYTSMWRKQEHYHYFYLSHLDPALCAHIFFHSQRKLERTNSLKLNKYFRISKCFFKWSSKVLGATKKRKENIKWNGKKAIKQIWGYGFIFLFCLYGFCASNTTQTTLGSSVKKLCELPQQVCERDQPQFEPKNYNFTWISIQTVQRI